jgi:hypothetical protein
VNSLANGFDLFSNELTRLRARRFPSSLVTLGSLKGSFLRHDWLLSNPPTALDGRRLWPWLPAESRDDALVRMRLEENLFVLVIQLNRDHLLGLPCSNSFRLRST